MFQTIILQRESINNPLNIQIRMMNDWLFEGLMPTKKVNDSEYDMYWIGNWPSRRDLFVCPSGCSSAKLTHVSRSRNNGNDDKVLRFMSSYCIGNQRNNTIYNGDYCLERRMRGGGGEEEVYRMSQGSKQTECLRNSKNVRVRGVTYEMSSNYATVDPVEIQTYYQRGSREFHANKSFTRESCSSITCLTQAFKEAQEFVDSIGNAGPSFINPTENLFYRARVVPKNDESKDYFANSLCTGSCNPWKNSTPFTLSVPDQGGIVREGVESTRENQVAQPSLSLEAGPCGKFICKSRRKKQVQEESLNAAESKDKLLTLNMTRKSSRSERRNDRFRRYRRRGYANGSRGDGMSRRTKRVNYVYLAGDNYSGSSVYGHRNCSTRRKRVPANMGWLWTQYEAVGRLKPRVGWRPGAISRHIRQLIRDGKTVLAHRNSRPASTTSIEWRGKKFKTKSHTSLKKCHARNIDEKQEETLEPPPTLHIQRRDGVYYVTMYPIRDEAGSDISKLNEPIKPLQFKIVKNRGSDSCNSSSTASDIDIEFSPPAAVNRYDKKPNVIHIETQVVQQEILNAFKPIDVKPIEKKEKKIKMKRHNN